jgi:hypothetical protein
MLTRKFTRIALLFGLAFSASTFVGCKSQPEVKTADSIPQGQMPEGGEWRGVYYNENLGFLHLTENGGAIIGAWRTTAGDKWGELHGEAKGDLLRYTWIERKIGVVGPSAESEGKGYFKYTLGKEGEAHELEGEWGLGDNEMGHSWDCIKQTNQEPDPKSVRPNEMESRVGASGFDGSKGDSDIGASDEDKEDAEKKEVAPSDDPL